jgi:hypothetical protein
MDRIIKILISKVNKVNKIFKLIDSFWFDYKSYLSPKISNFYKVHNIISLKTDLIVNLNKSLDLK